MELSRPIPVAKTKPVVCSAVTHELCETAAGTGDGLLQTVSDDFSALQHLALELPAGGEDLDDRAGGLIAALDGFHDLVKVAIDRLARPADPLQADLVQEL